MIIPKKYLLLFLVVVLAGSLFYFFALKQGILSSDKEPSDKIEEEAVETTETPLPVKVRTVDLGELVIKMRFPGEAVTDRRTVIKTEVSGNVKAFHVKEGQSVQQGELLVELDSREFQLEVEKAEASRLKILSEILLDNQFAEKNASENASFTKNLEAEKKIYDEVYQQYQQGLVSEDDFEQALKKFEIVMIESGQKKDDIMAATKNLTQQEINVKKAQMNLEKTRITAPFSGIITEIKAVEQQQVTASFELFTIVNTSRVNVHARVLESDIGKMQIGREVDLFFSAFPDQTIEGKVKVVSPIVNSEDKTCKVIISIEKSAVGIKPGMHAEVEIEADIFENKLLVPKEAIIVRSGKKMVFVVEEGFARRRYIETGQENDYFAEVFENNDIDSGLKEGDVVIIEGHFTLAQNARVRVLED
ncbi:efflux RND transporter periplasmic adaptor subunit [Acidobacteriota bacterium]